MHKEVSIIHFPGSNCDRDLAVAIKYCLKLKPKFLWHNESHIKDPGIIIIPGGFSFGDYLRAGILATKSPAIKEVIRHAKKGVPIIGICNGFQILTECKLLEGALIKNSSQLFNCRKVFLRIENKKNYFTKNIKKKIVQYPIAHSQGKFYVDDYNLKKLQDNDQIMFRYSSKTGDISNKYNPNGSIQNIAGIVNRKKNVLGLMPHPERAIDNFSGKDGIGFFKGLSGLI
ncbi:MAG: phosphoribosylformylglycinamidine synthase I [Alphaproteobacteria bacterium]